MAEQSGEHPFESHMPPRETSLEDFVKLENYCSQDKSDDDIGVLGEFHDVKTDSGVHLLTSEKEEPFFSSKELDVGVVSGKTEDFSSKGFDDLKDFDPYMNHGSGGSRYLGKLDEQEETIEKFPKDALKSTLLDDFGFGDKLTSSQKADSSKPEEVSQPSQYEKLMQASPKKPEPAQIPLKKEQTPEKKKNDAPSKQEEPTSTTPGCPFSPSALFDSARLNPVVSNLVYWRDLKKSGIVFGALVFLLISMRFFSLISVAAYLTLAVQGVTISFRIYKNILQAVQKSNDGHPFREYLEMDIELPKEKASEMAEVIVKHLNCTAKRIRSLILVEDLVDSIKLGILVWIMTYVGAWFNGLTLVTIAFVMAFTIPKIYETYKVQIDQYLDIACSQVTGVLQVVKSKLPFGQKDKQQ